MIREIAQQLGILNKTVNSDVSEGEAMGQSLRPCAAKCYLSE